MLNISTVSLFLNNITETMWLIVGIIHLSKEVYSFSGLAVIAGLCCERTHYEYIPCVNNSVSVVCR
jgi:hypothetical protein